MKKVKSLKVLFLLLLAVGIFVGFSSDVYAEDLVEYAKNKFANNEYTIYTDASFDGDNLDDGTTPFQLLIGTFGLASYEEYDTDSGYIVASVRQDVDRYSCDYSSMKCSFHLYKHFSDNSNQWEELIGDYENVDIIIDSNIDSFFPMMSGDKIVVNYPEEFVASGEDKWDFALRHLNDDYSGDWLNSVYYERITFEDGQMFVRRSERRDGRLVSEMYKKLGGYVFSYTESPYSDNFKRLTEGTLTIKTDSEIDNSLLDAYLQEMNGDGSLGFFFRSGDIRDGKAFIGLQKYINNTYQTEEMHLVTLAKDTNIDVDAFITAGYDGGVDILADEPSNNKADYIYNYFNVHNNCTNHDDGSYECFSVRVDYSNPNEVTIFYSKYDNQSKRTDLQFRRAHINFVGYVTTYSNEYNETIGSEITINADSLNYNAISDALWRMIHGGALSVYVLGCDDDCSFCDVAVYGSEFGAEIHKVKILLDDTMSDEFKEAFNLKDDGTIDIIMDKDAILDSWGFSYYTYNENDNLEFNCDLNDSCKLRLSNYEYGITESHNVKYNTINSSPTSYFSSLVNSSVDVYPGENINVWDINYVSGIFSKNEYDYGTSALKCDSAKKKCSVAKFNSNKQLEIHNTAVSIKNGKSPKFESIAPGDKISLNAIYLDDDMYIDDVSSAYFLSKSKAYMYLSDYDGGKAKLVYNNYETHTMGIEFAKGNPRHKAAVDGVIEKIGSSPLKFYIDDLEYVNYFYYTDRSYALPNNYNSKSMKDELSKIIDNKHISYYLLERSGMGDRFMEEWGGEVVLYYDGIAYGRTKSYFVTDKRNVIYIPDNTPNTKEAYVAAAQKRVDSYLGKKSGVVISYLEPAEDSIMDYFGGDIDMTGFDGNYYHIAYRDKEEDILILKNSKKMQSATFHASDVSNNVDVSSDNANYPTNTVVSAETIDKTTKKYKDLLKKLGLSVAQVVDISLYSPSIGDINNFNGVSFSVNVPIQTSLFGSGNLYAYFVSDDGKIEEHPIAMDDFMGMFGTNHFSTYVIAEKVDNKVIEEANNPSTYDDVKMWIVTGSLCGIGLAGALVYIKAKVLRKTR